MELRLKQEYIGCIITVSHEKLGKITIDTMTIKPEEYQFFYENGFKDLFTVIKPIPYKGIEQSGKSE